MKIILNVIIFVILKNFFFLGTTYSSVSPGKLPFTESKTSPKTELRKPLKNSGISYALMDLKTGKVVDSKFPSEPRSLASVSKLLTFYFALKVLGHKDHFKTEVYKEGPFQMVF